MPISLPLSNNPTSICIMRLSAIGDVTHVLPVVNAIKKQWPDCKITWIIGKLERKLLANVDGIEFIEFNKRGGFQAVRTLRNTLKERRFDVLLHMQVAARANILSRLVKAHVRLGWDRARSRDAHHWFINASVPEVAFQHQVDGFLSFAQSLGAKANEPEWQLSPSSVDREWVQKHVPDERPLLVISPCSSHPLRNWNARGYARAADHAVATLGMQVVLAGGPAELERRMAADIEQQMQHQVLNLVGKDTLTQSIALMERAQLLISPDSGPAHIASAVNTPVIGLHAATWSRRSGPWRSLDLCVDRFGEAARKFKNCEPEELRWGTRIEQPGVMDLITDDDVISRLERFSF